MATNIESSFDGLVDYACAACAGCSAEQFVDHGGSIRDNYHCGRVIYLRDFFHHESEDVGNFPRWCCVS